MLVTALALCSDAFAKEFATDGVKHDTLNLRSADVNAEAMLGSWTLSQYGTLESQSLRSLIGMSAPLTEEIEQDAGFNGLARATSHDFKAT